MEVIFYSFKKELVFKVRIDLESFCDDVSVVDFAMTDVNLTKQCVPLYVVEASLMSRRRHAAVGALLVHCMTCM